ncbi:hypothetical protein DJ70_02035 [Halorubrum halodurans]|uniref:Uncharacterized protein n=1 Tax=Halorubrum halodurans TaxID=1383851 RepID=A0A256IRN4_9EURY|nr:hypothetical protein DJ70_02035 [Halorubrum halodurans]
MESGATGDPDDTERPRLTSDLLLRRSAGGEILILRGPERCPARVINPSDFVGPAKPGRVERPEFACAFFAFRPNRGRHLTPSERVDRPPWAAGRCPRRGDLRIPFESR